MGSEKSDRTVPRIENRWPMCKAHEEVVGRNQTPIHGRILDITTDTTPKSHSENIQIRQVVYSSRINSFEKAIIKIKREETRKNNTLNYKTKQNEKKKIETTSRDYHMEILILVEDHKSPSPKSITSTCVKISTLTTFFLFGTPLP